MGQTSRDSRGLRSRLALLAAFLAGAVASRVLPWPSAPLQTLVSPDRAHRAELWRSDHFVDRNYSVYVDGRRVFGSPDFVPRNDIPFREALFWDRTGRSVILEVAGRRIFGYDATARRRLTDSDLLAAEPPPERPLWEYSSEIEWPGVGRVAVPDRGR